MAWPEGTRPDFLKLQPRVWVDSFIRMRIMDLNADVGEGGQRDAVLIALVSSANIACGGHTGDDASMRSAIDACLAAGVAVGAHPGYEDPAHFGRRELNLSPSVVEDLVARQVSRMVEIAARAGASLHHVKPHGALYHQADRDSELATAVAECVARIVPGCGFYVPPAGCLAKAGADTGLQVIAEGFIDRRYTANGELVSRSLPDAVIDDVAEAVTQALQIVREGMVKTVAGTLFPLAVKTLCVHGDSPQALEILHAVRHAWLAAGIKLQAP